MYSIYKLLYYDNINAFKYRMYIQCYLYNKSS